MATMEREKLMLSQDITIMAMLAMDMVAMVTMAMAREKLKLMLSQDITTMVTLMDMAMDMAIMDMVDMVTMDMDMERGRPPPLIIVMILVDMIMALVISFSKFVESSQPKHRPDLY